MLTTLVVLLRVAPSAPHKGPTLLGAPGQGVDGVALDARAGERRTGERLDPLEALDISADVAGYLSR